MLQYCYFLLRMHQLTHSVIEILVVTLIGRLLYEIRAQELKAIKIYIHQHTHLLPLAQCKSSLKQASMVFFFLAKHSTKSKFFTSIFIQLMLTADNLSTLGHL